MRRRVIAVLILGGLAVLPAESASAGLRVRDGLSVTRPDGTRVAFRPDVRVWCGRWAPDVATPAIHVTVGARLTPRWELLAVVADVRRRPLVRLPNSFVFDHPKGALFFATDRRNELNSDTGDSTGTIRFGRVRCGRRLAISFRVSGHIGSELSDGEPVTVRGSFSASAS
jgi:hypothetical protein